MLNIHTVISFPSGGELRGSQKWSAGPGLVALVAPAPWTPGILANTIWSLAGDSSASDVSQGLLQYFIVRTFAGGWYVNSAPVLTVNWKAESGQQWIVPFGAGTGEIVRLGRLPINSQVGACYNVVKPDFSPDWQVRVQVQILLPTSILKGGLTPSIAPCIIDLIRAVPSFCVPLNRWQVTCIPAT